MSDKGSQSGSLPPPVVDVGRFLGVVKKLGFLTTTPSKVREEIREISGYINDYEFMRSYAKYIEQSLPEDSDKSLLKHLFGPLKLFWFEQTWASHTLAWNADVVEWQIWSADPRSLPPLSVRDARPGETCFAKLHKGKHIQSGGVTYSGGLVVSGSVVHRQDRAWICRTSASTRGELEQVEIGRWDNGMTRWCSSFRLFSVYTADLSNAFDTLENEMESTHILGRGFHALSEEFQGIIHRLELLFHTHQLSASICRNVREDLATWVECGKHPRLDTSPKAPLPGSIALGPPEPSGCFSYWYVLASVQVSLKDPNKDLVLVCRVFPKEKPLHQLTSKDLNEYRDQGIIRIEADDETINFDSSLRPAHIDVTLVRSILVSQLGEATLAPDQYLKKARNVFSRLLAE